MKTYFLLLLVLLAGCGSDNADKNAITKNGITKTTHLIPLYSHPPSDAWDKLFLYKHLTQDDVMVIINPSNGNFTHKSIAYKKVLEQLHQNNIFTVGYLYTNYAQRDIKEIKKNIDAYKKYYSTVDGFFFDEMNESIEQLDYYKELLKYDQKYSIVNPGTKIDQEYIDERFIDLVVDYEGNHERRRTFNSANEKTKLAVIYYNAPVDAKAPKNIHYQYIDNDTITKNFSLYLTPKSWQLYSTLAHNAKLQYPNSHTSYIFPDDLEKLPKSVQFFMDKKLMQMKNCNAERNEFRFSNEFNTTNTKNSLELNVSLSGNNDVTFMQIQSKPNYVPLLRISYKDKTLWAHIKESNNETTTVNLGDYHSGEVVKEEVDNGTLYIYIDSENIYSKDISYWGKNSFFKFGLYPQTAGCDELNVTNITLGN
ncbi:Spherulin-4 precursor [hydrothermal vent metagenome]|uniref:Spherulin-4 n=1 Tax=hydrothermal vent metagenome TaxID=652676 RepID=A0A1W1BLR9_9ZZZZ